MEAYVITSGAIFGLLAVAHVLRIIGEDADLVSEPFYMAITAAAAALCGWPFYVLRRGSVAAPGR
jgi:hypothetical protein